MAGVTCFLSPASGLQHQSAMAIKKNISTQVAATSASACLMRLCLLRKCQSASVGCVLCAEECAHPVSELTAAFVLSHTIHVGRY